MLVCQWDHHIVILAPLCLVDREGVGQLDQATFQFPQGVTNHTIVHEVEFDLDCDATVAHYADNRADVSVAGETIVLQLDYSIPQAVRRSVDCNFQLIWGGRINVCLR